MLFVNPEMRNKHGKRIERMQLTAYATQYLGSLSEFDTEHFEFERVSTGISTSICAYGYREVATDNNGQSRMGPWLKIKEAKNLTEMRSE